MSDSEIGRVVNTVLEIKNVRQAVKYYSPTEVLCVTRKLFRGKIDRRDNIDLVVKIGKPNFEQRAFIKKCKKAGEPFPIKKIQIKYVPIKKK